MKKENDVGALQEELVRLDGLCRCCCERSAAVRALLVSASTSTNSVVLEEAAQALEEALREVRVCNEAFLIHAARLGKDLRARKLRSDYDRRLDAKGTAKEAAHTLRRARLALLEFQKRQADFITQNKAQNGRQEMGFSSKTMRLSLEEESVLFQKAPGVTHNETVQMVALREYDESSSRLDESTQLQRVARNAQLVQEMATEVGSLVELQGDDVSRLEENTDDSVARTLEGVHELSRARRRQASSGATKATLGTATVGGLVGIVGGPLGIVLGAAAGGVVGMTAGKGVAAVKRRSINAETRRIKALLVARRQKRGEFTMQLYAYENQQWSYIKRKWMDTDRIWTDEFGCILTSGAHPDVEMSAMEARLHLLAAAKANSNNLSEGEQKEIEGVHAKELELGVEWRWATAKWELSMSRPGTDLGGWDYAPSLASDRWTESSARNCVVRRRLWIRYLEGNPGQALAKEVAARQREKLHEMKMRNVEGAKRALSEHERQTEEMWSRIYENSVTTNAIMSESIKVVNEQGRQISKAERNATVVEDATMYSERIDRASRFSGALRNMVTWSEGRLKEADSYAKEFEKRRQLAEEEHDARHKQHLERSNNGKELAFDFAEESSRNFDENLHLARSMAGELENQNLQLDRTAVAVDRGNNSVVKLTKKIK